MYHVPRLFVCSPLLPLSYSHLPPFYYRVRWELIQEEKKIMKALEAGGANDALDTRLGEVRKLYDVLYFSYLLTKERLNDVSTFELKINLMISTISMRSVVLPRFLTFFLHTKIDHHYDRCTPSWL